MQLLKQSTAATIKLGPFLDSTDGLTAETGLTISQADIRLSKNGGNIAQTNNATGATHDELGYYDVPLDTTDTATLGRLRVIVHESGALPVWQDFMVLPAEAYDALVLGTDNLTADLTSAAATAVRTEMDSNSTQLAAIVGDTNEMQGLLPGSTIAAASDVPSTAAINTAVEGGQVGTDAAAAAAISPPTAGAIADAVWDEVATPHNVEDSFGQLVLETDGLKTVAVATNTRTLLALPAVAPDGAGGLPVSDAGGLDMDQMAVDAGSAGAAGTVTADRVAKSSTFFVGTEGNESRNIVTLNSWSTGTRTLGYDLKEYLQGSDTGLNAVSSVTVINNSTSASITTSDLRKHQGGYVALWDTAACVAGTYTVTVTVTTLDSNTVVVTGTLEVE